MYEKITPQNVVMYAIKNYDNPQCEGEKEYFARTIVRHHFIS